MPQLKITNDILAAAVIGFEVQKFAIEGKIAEIRQMLGGNSEPAQATAAKPKKRKLSAAGRRAIVAATKKRWAAVKAAKQGQKPAKAKKAVR